MGKAGEAVVRPGYPGRRITQMDILKSTITKQNTFEGQN